jgi:hypothetical protein
MRILNLTQHAATAEQLDAGVVEPTNREAVCAALTFYEPPPKGDILWRCRRLCDIAQAEKAYAVMIGGAPWLMPTLERWLLGEGIQPLYAFSTQESVDTVQSDGSVRKTAVFRHVGFVPAVEVGVEAWTQN